MQMAILVDAFILHDPKKNVSENGTMIQICLLEDVYIYLKD